MSHIKKLNEMAEQSEDSFNVKFAKELSQKYRHIDWDIENGDSSSSRESYDGKSSGNGLASSEDYAESAKRMIDYYIKDSNYSKKRITIPKNILYHFNELTSQNFHYEVRYEIANYLSNYSNKFEEFKAYFKYIIDNRANYNTEIHGFGALYFIITDCMFIQISKIFGKKVASDINACL